MFGRVYRPENSKFGIMASILDQFEEAADKMIVAAKPTIQQEYDDDSPIFHRTRVDFFPTDNITHLCACADIILIAMSNNVLHRINTRQPDVPAEIDLAKYSSSMRISGLFLSPNGQHALISMLPKLTEAQPELLYLSRNSIKLKPLSKFRGVEVTAVAWNTWQQTGVTSGPILLGTSRGLLIESEVGGDAEGIFTSGVADYKQVFDIGKNSLCIITGLHMYKTGNHCHIIATTSNKICHYHANVSNQDEKSMIQHVFRKYLYDGLGCGESINTSSKFSKLDIFVSNDKLTYFGWLTELGLYYGQVPEDDSRLLSNSEVIQYADGFPVDFLLTGYHALLVYKTHVSFIRLLSHKTIFKDMYTTTDGPDSDPRSRPKRVIREPTRGKIFVFTDRAVFSYKVRKEDRDIWLEYIERGEFDKARDCCHDNPVHLDRITTRQAEALFTEQDFELSAFYYAQSASISFEEVALKFLRAEQSAALMRFLKLRLDSLQPDDNMQRTMLVVWLVELYLSKLGKVPGYHPEHARLQTELDELLSMPAVSKCVSNNKGTIYDLMAAHGDTKNLIKLSIACLDYERVIRQHLFKSEYDEALDVLKKALPSRKELLYTFAPSLITHISTKLIMLIMQFSSELNPSKLLPALALVYESGTAARDVAQYLQHCVDALSCTDQSVHNLLLAIYARHQPDRLRIYLAQQGQDLSSVHYDVHFALRLCQEKGLTEACVQLSALLGLWMAAVELALTVNVELAVQTANLHHSDPELLKTLWLKIAEHVVKEKHDIKAAMEFLKKCPLLKIEDILPFFPDFVTIDDFKGAICSSLQEYRQHIKDLKDEMDESSKSAELIEQEISVVKNRHVVVRWSDICAVCDLQLLLRAFYVFPCAHHYHIDCMQDIVFPTLTPAVRQRLRDLQRQLATVATDDASSASSAMTARDLIQSGIDTILASECPQCGDTMVDSVDKPFVDDENFERELKDWS